MKRSAGAWLLLAALSGCASMEQGSESARGPGGCPGPMGSSGPPTVPGVQGPWGQPVPMAAPYSSMNSPGAAAARAMMSRSMPLDLVQPYLAAAQPGSGIVQVGAQSMPGADSGVVRANDSAPAAGPPAGTLVPPGAITPPGFPAIPGMPAGGPPSGGAGLLGGRVPPIPGAVAAFGALPTGGLAPARFPTMRTSVRFVGPPGMKISWYTQNTEGKPGFSSAQIEAPGRYNFAQAAIYRLKLSDIPNRPNIDLYPTLEVVPSNSKTDPFLAHSSVPLNFTEEDFDQAIEGNYIVKVIYLPDPQHQDLASTGLGEIVSSRLDPNLDPIGEALRRGSILLVVRMGNIDLEAPNTPAMDAPNPYIGRQPGPPGVMPRGILPPGLMPGMGMPGMGMPGMGMPGMGMPGMGMPGMGMPGMGMPGMGMPGMGMPGMGMPGMGIPGLPPGMGSGQGQPGNPAGQGGSDSGAGAPGMGAAPAMPRPGLAAPFGMMGPGGSTFFNGPNGPFPGMPSAPPAAAPSPAGPGTPAVPAANGGPAAPGNATTGPVSRLPDPGTIQPARFPNPTAPAAASPVPSATGSASPAASAPGSAAPEAANPAASAPGSARTPEKKPAGDYPWWAFGSKASRSRAESSSSSPPKADK